MPAQNSANEIRKAGDRLTATTGMRLPPSGSRRNADWIRRSCRKVQPNTRKKATDQKAAMRTYRPWSSLYGVNRPRRSGVGGVAGTGVSLVRVMGRRGSARLRHGARAVPASELLFLVRQVLAAEGAVLPLLELVRRLLALVRGVVPVGALGAHQVDEAFLDLHGSGMRARAGPGQRTAVP